MTNDQSKLFELLLEVKKICDQNKIDYYLCEYLLTDAVLKGEITGTYHDFSIMMRADDVYKFIEAVDKIENREIDSLLNNGKFPGTYLRYVAKDTLYFPIYRYDKYKKFGFGINIKILKNVPKNKLKSKVNTFLESGIEINNNNVKPSKRRLPYLVFIKMLGIIGKENRGKLIFNSLNKVTNSQGKQKYLYYKPTLGKRKKYDIQIFNKTKKIKLNGIDFKIPDDQRYVDINIDKTKPTPFSTFGATYIIDQNISYEDYFKECKKQKFPKSFYRKRKKLLKKEEKIKPYRKYVNKCWDLLFRTRDRFELLELYEPQKSHILKLYSDNNFEELENILKDYIDMLYLYASKGLTIIFDPVIFEITMEILSQKGHMEIVRKCIKNAPKEHLIPLKVDLEIK